MCGIYASTSPDAQERVFQGLKRLEYRGYDSWGVAVLHKSQIQIEKHVGKMAGVASLSLPQSSLALGHTRWATHGGVTQVNAHPHLASDGSFALVQNGVMENYQEVQADLLAKGYAFVSQTDTEVLVHLIEQVASETHSAVDFAVLARAFALATGRNTIALLTTSQQIFAIRDGSPLVVGRSKDGFFLSSDVLSLCADAQEYIALESGQGVSIIDGTVTLYNADTLEVLPLVWTKVDVAAQIIDKGGYPHFMIKEIHEQALVLRDVVRQPVEKCAALLEMLRQARHIYTLGSGGASFSAAFIAHTLREHGLGAIELKAYESRSHSHVWNYRDVCIVVSQSGESADTMEVIEWMKAKGVKIISLVNMPGSTMERLADLHFALQVGPEIGVASTKAMSGQMTWGIMVGELLAGQNLTQIQQHVEIYEEELKLWLADEQIKKTLATISAEWKTIPELFVLGRGALYASVLEFALKLKEISYIHAEGFSGGELKHGPIALIEKGSVVVCLIAQDEEKAEMLNATAQVKARGAHVVGVSPENNQLFDTWIRIPTDPTFAPISAFIPAQLLTYATAVAKKLDPDKPRNLAKSVTVK